MSYYQANYYRNPVPYMSPNMGAPVPWWGSDSRIAGPKMVGVGQTAAPMSKLRFTPTMRIKAMLAPSAPAPSPIAAEEEKSIFDQWWIYPVGALVLVGAAVGIGVATGKV